MHVTVTYYLDVISSWCFWAEPAWAELKENLANEARFEWKIALMDSTGLPASRAQLDWFYRRSGTLMRSPFMLNSAWLDLDLNEYLAPNAVAEAAKDFGVRDDRVRLALAHAAMREGRRVGQWQEAIAIGAEAAGIDRVALEEKAGSEEIERRMRATTAEFHSLQINQRPAFLITDSIGDRAVISGLVNAEALGAVIEAMWNDAAGYASYRAHHGEPPAS
jgi:predicted DsbA family dithiol-disulfide isomerase